VALQLGLGVGLTTTGRKKIYLLRNVIKGLNVGRIISGHRTVEGSCEHGNERSGSLNVGKFLSGGATGSFSRRAQLHGVKLDDVGQSDSAPGDTFLRKSKNAAFLNI
jgi:hypothetical protein